MKEIAEYEDNLHQSFDVFGKRGSRLKSSIHTNMLVPLSNNKLVKLSKQNKFESSNILLRYQNNLKK